MIKYFLFGLLLLNNIAQAQIVNIPDPVFKDALLNWDVVDTNGDNNGDQDADINNDGEIQESEAAAVIGLQLNFSSFDISSLSGIEYFINLEYINFTGNSVETVNFSENTNLKVVYGGSNNLANIDVSNNLALESLRIGYNNQLTSIDVTNNTSLTYLNVQACSISGYLDVTQNIILERLYADDNEISSINLTQNPNLIRLNLEWNQFINLDISQNPNITQFDCYYNPPLLNLNIKNGNNTVLNDFDAHSNSNLSCIQVDDIDYANSNFNWIKDSWAIYSEDCILGVQDFDNIAFNLYPNPTKDILFIEIEEPFEIIKIYTINGRLVKETTSSSLNVSELPTGFYFVKIYINGLTTTRKFVKS